MAHKTFTMQKFFGLKLPAGVENKSKVLREVSLDALTRRISKASGLKFTPAEMHTYIFDMHATHGKLAASKTLKAWLGNEAIKMWQHVNLFAYVCWKLGIYASLDIPQKYVTKKAQGRQARVTVVEGTSLVETAKRVFAKVASKDRPAFKVALKALVKKQTYVKPASMVTLAKKYGVALKFDK